MQSCVLNCSSPVQFFAILWTIAHQAPLSKGILQARILEWVVVSSRGSSQLRDQTQVSYPSACIGRQVLYHYATWVARGAARANTKNVAVALERGNEKRLEEF